MENIIINVRKPKQGDVEQHIQEKFNSFLR